jgi:hypothetical protein
MQRDWHFIRPLLKKVQDDDHSEIVDVPLEVILERVAMLSEAGLIECDIDQGGEPLWVAARLTWQGHDFIDSAANEGVYKQAIQKARAAGSVSFEIVKTVIAELAKQAVFVP